MYTSGESVIGMPIRSDCTETEDGVFVISLDDVGVDDAEMSYCFVDNERNTLEAEVKIGDKPQEPSFILKRIPSEEEIKIHIVSFKLDESIESAGYVLSDELVAIKAGDSFGEDGLPKLKQNDTEEPALFTLADGTEFTKDTPVTEDITVTVAHDTTH